MTESLRVRYMAKTTEVQDIMLSKMKSKESSLGS